MIARLTFADGSSRETDIREVPKTIEVIEGTIANGWKVRLERERFAPPAYVETSRTPCVPGWRGTVRLR